MWEPASEQWVYGYGLLVAADCASDLPAGAVVVQRKQHPETATLKCFKRLVENTAVTVVLGDSAFDTLEFHERCVDSEAQTRLQDEGFLPANCGISVKPVSYWQEQHAHTVDRALFEYLCWDGIMTCLWFDIAYSGLERGITAMEDWVTAVFEDDAGLDCETNVAQTYRWLQKLY